MMAAAILTTLANVPWGQVIDYAPKLVEQAQRLIASSRAGAADAREANTPDALAGLRMDLEGQAAELADLRRDLVQASELLGQLAQTNQLLIAKLT